MPQRATRPGGTGPTDTAAPTTLTGAAPPRATGPLVMEVSPPSLLFCERFP